MRLFNAMTLAGAALVLLSACDTSAPYSNTVDTQMRGVGFSDYSQYLRAQEELARIRRAEEQRARSVPTPPGAPQYGGAAMPPPTIGQEAVAAVRARTEREAPAAPNTQAASAAPMPQQEQPIQTAAQQQQPQREAGVSEQQFTPQPFGTAQQNQLVQRDVVPQVRVSPEEMGQPSAGGAPNLFVYALSTRHNVGDVRYERSHPLRWRRWEAACARFPTQDLAQEAFLAAGGPERDPNHLDPDGDGFACWWDPAPFRQAARTARARE